MRHDSDMDHDGFLNGEHLRRTSPTQVCEECQREFVMDDPRDRVCDTCVSLREESKRRRLEQEYAAAATDQR